jgi:hypothetical protein
MYEFINRGDSAMVLAKQNGQRHERHVRKATRLEDSDVGRGGSSGRRHRGSDGVRASMQHATETLVIEVLVVCFSDDGPCDYQQC